MFRKTFYSLLAATIVVAMASVASHASTVYCVCPGATSAPYLYQFDGTCSQMTSCTISGLEGLPCYSGEISSNNTSLGIIIITTNAGNSDWTGTRASGGDIYLTDYTAINGDYYFFWEYTGTTMYNLTSTTSGTASGQYFMSNGNDWGTKGASLNTTSYGNVYAASVTLEDEISEFLLCSSSYGDKVGTSSTVEVNTMYTLSSYSNNVSASISAGDYSVYYISDNPTGGGYLYITEATTSSESDDDDTTTSKTVQIKGAYSGDDWATLTDFTQTEDDENTWTVTIDNFYGQFGLMIDGTWYGTASKPDGNYWGYTSDEMEEGVTLASGGSGYNMLIIDPNGNSDETYIWASVTFTVQYSDGTYTLYATCTSSWNSGTSSGLYLVGDYNEWTFSSSCEFTSTSTENQYSLTINNFASTGNFAVADEDYSINLGGSSVILEIASSESEATDVTLGTAGYENNAYFNSEATYASVTFILTISGDTYTLKAYGTETVALSTSDYDYYIVGDWNEIDGEWLPNPLGKLEADSEGNLTTTISDFYGYFKVICVPTGRYDVEDATWLTSNESHNLALSEKTGIAANYSNDQTDNNMAVVSSSTTYSSLTFSLTLTDGDEIAYLTVTENSASTEEDTSGTDTSYYLVTSFNDYSYKVASVKDTSSDDTSTTSTTSITYSVTFESEDYYNTLVNSYGNGDGDVQGICAYAWYYTEEGTEVHPLGDWPGTDLGFEAYSDTKSVTLPTTTSLNLVINNGHYAGAESGAYQTKDIVPGAYYGTYEITISSTGDEYGGGGAYYVDYSTSTTPNNTINFYIIPDETIGQDETTAPLLYIWDTEKNEYNGSFNSETELVASSNIEEISGKYLWKYTVNNPNSALNLIMHYDGETYKTVDITGIVADVYLNYLYNTANGTISTSNYKTIALNIDVVDDDTEDESTVDYSGWKFEPIKLKSSTYEEDESYVYFDAVIVALSEDATLDNLTSIDASSNGITLIEGYAEDFKLLAADNSGNFYVQQGNTGNRWGHSSAVIYGNTTATDYTESFGWYEYSKGTYLTQLQTSWDEENSDADYMFFLIGMEDESDVVNTSDGGRYVAVVLATTNGVETGIEKADADGNVIVAETYYTVQGLQVQNPEDRNFYIVVRKYADGTTQAFKEAICK